MRVRRVARGGRVSPAAGLAAVLVAACLSQPAAAALGESVETVAQDRAALRGSLVTRPMLAYDVHEITADTGTTVREYVAPGGAVFAVTWNGTRAPDLKLLLGRYFNSYVEAGPHRASHHVLTINAPDVALTVVRYQRMAAGQAYLPALMPAGVTREALK